MIPVWSQFRTNSGCISSIRTVEYTSSRKERLINREYKELRRSYQRRETHKSHYQFINSCLHNHVIPKGLRLNTTPLVPKIASLQHTLQTKWTAVLNNTSSVLLKHLKTYHRDAISILTKKIIDLEAKLRIDANFQYNLNQISINTEKVAVSCKKRKERKLMRLLQDRPKKTIHRRKKEQKKPKIINKETMINLSNAPLSEGELTLLSRGSPSVPDPQELTGSN